MSWLWKSEDRLSEELTGVLLFHHVNPRDGTRVSSLEAFSFNCGAISSTPEFFSEISTQVKPGS